MLTTTTQIPTAVRSQIRAIVKAHPDWPAYLTEKGLVSASARNAELIEFTLRHPSLTWQVEALLNVSPNGGATDSPDALMEDAPSDDAQTDNAAQGAGFEVDSVLSNVDQFLSPLVRKEIANALAPVVAAANRGPVEIERVVEVERIVEVEVAAGQTPRVKPIQKARRDKKVPFRSLFPSKARDPWNDALITLWTGAPSPAVDPFYVVDRLQMALLTTAIERCANTWLTGPSGTGKSTMPEQAAAATGRGFVKIGMTKQTDVDALVGSMGFHGGATVWEDGPLVKAMRLPGTIILIDELTIAPAGVQAIIQLVSDDHRSITLPTGEVVKAADGVVFIVADNTAGSGDEGGLYAGTNVSNAALVTRFKRMIHVDYLSAQKEAEALANHTACPLPAAKHLADFVAQARRLPALQGVVISLRQMVGFVQCVQDGFSAKEAFAIAISSRMPATERAAIDALADLTWQNAFNALFNGQTPAAPVTPSNSASAEAFSDQTF